MFAAYSPQYYKGLGLTKGATAELVMGGTLERGALGPSLVFIFIWSTLVYDAVACWTWNSHGWIFVLGGLDFAGGGNTIVPPLTLMF
jgi:ammonium transporter, Amt family